MYRPAGALSVFALHGTADAAENQLLDAGIDILLLAGVEEGVPAARAGADQTDLAVVVGLRSHPLHRRRGVADHLAGGLAAPAVAVLLRRNRLTERWILRAM